LAVTIGSLLHAARRSSATFANEDGGGGKGGRDGGEGIDNSRNRAGKDIDILVDATFASPGCDPQAVSRSRRHPQADAPPARSPGFATVNQNLPEFITFSRLNGRTWAP
jgi:hypothetical protein